MRNVQRAGTYKVHDDLAVGVRLEDGVLVLEALAEGKMVVDLAVDAERERLIRTQEGLGTGVCERARKRIREACERVRERLELCSAENSRLTRY